MTSSSSSPPLNPDPAPVPQISEDKDQLILFPGSGRGAAPPQKAEQDAGLQQRPQTVSGTETHVFTPTYVYITCSRRLDPKPLTKGETINRQTLGTDALGGCAARPASLCKHSGVCLLLKNPNKKREEQRWSVLNTSFYIKLLHIDQQVEPGSVSVLISV